MFPGIRLAKSWVKHGGEKQSIGDGLFATRNFAAGQEILQMKRPLVGSLDAQRLEDTCANCYVWTEGSLGGSRLYVPEGTKVQKCAGCQRYRYCSKKCQKEAWTRGHKHECKRLKTVTGDGMPKAVMACIEILVRRKNGLISDELWGAILNLEPHINDFKRLGLYSNIELMAMGAGEFSSTANNFDRDFIIAMYARVLANSLTLITPTLDPLGIIFDPVLGKVNHSCDPNAFVMMDGAVTSLRTLKPIKKDEEIHISYIDNTNPYLRRQSELAARWFFRCHCTKCGEGALAKEDKFKGKPTQLSAKICKDADEILKGPGYELDAADHLGDSAAEKRVGAIQGYLFDRLEEAQGSSSTKEAFTTIKEAMRMCRDSKIWPLYRQPYAALRDEYIVNLVTTGQFGPAWDHCAKRMKYVDSELFQEHHPVRVVHMWQSTMLAIYVAGISEGMEGPGDTMPLVAMLLGTQTVEAVEKSHGNGSAFAKSVLQKVEEMRAELERVHGQLDSPRFVQQKLMPAASMLSSMGDWAKL